MIPNELSTGKKIKLKAILNMFHWNILLLLLSYNQVTPFIISFGDLKDIVDFAFDVYDKYEKVNDIYDALTNPKDTTLDDVLESVKEISSKVEELGNRVELQIDKAVQVLLQRLPLDASLNTKKHDLHTAMGKVHYLFNHFISYVGSEAKFEKSTIEKFMETVISYDGNNLMDALERIHRLFASNETRTFSNSLFSLLRKESKVTELEICDSGITPQQALFQIYAQVVATQMRGFLMLSFAYTYLAVSQKKNYQESLKKTQRDFTRRAQELMAVAKAEIHKTARFIRRCDPETFIRGTNYLEFYRFIQGFIANEEQLSPYKSCGATCSTVQTPVANDSCWKGDRYQCLPRTCIGSVHDCVDDGGGVWRTCSRSSIPRRYLYFIDGYGNTNGEKEECLDGEKTFQWYWTFPYRCHYCMCICVEDEIGSLSLRAISFIQQTSDIFANMVVTGIRFVEENGMIHLQIQQAFLQGKGRIKKDSERWKKLERILPDRNKARIKGYEYFELFREGYSNAIELTYGWDYTVLKFDQKQIDLDDLFAPEGHVVTGIRFQHPQLPTRNQSEPIQLAIRITPFNYSTGKLLLSSKDQWISSEHMRKSSKGRRESRTEFNMNDNVGNPTRSPLNLPDSQPNSCIEFRASGFKEDAAQSTIPFLDSQPVYGEPSLPLGGVGLFHKGSRGSGGFLTLKIFGIDLSEYMG